MQNSVSVEGELSEYMDFEQMWEKKHKSDGSKDTPKYGASDFKFITVLGKGSFGKVRVCVCVCVCACACEGTCVCSELVEWHSLEFLWEACPSERDIKRVGTYYGQV